MNYLLHLNEREIIENIQVVHFDFRRRTVI